ncbi:sigma-E processing peptidase SpoIIGA [Lachnospiraceae bacterium LCP25S3_G4]
MTYELYVDVLFLVNFMMDYFVLLIVRKILKCSATHFNICIGSAVGSLLTCIVIVLPIPYAFMKLILFHVVINTFMIRIGLKIKYSKTFWKAFVTLYISAFLLGGVFEYLHQYVRIGSLFFAAAIVSYYVVQGVWRFITYIQKNEMRKCKVTLYLNNKEHTLNALVDTGNSLSDPMTGKPVSILERKTAKRLMNQEKIHSMRYIPYHTIGESTGVLPAIRLEKMCIHLEEEHWIHNPIIGICEQDISDKEEYQMILNPDLL